MKVQTKRKSGMQFGDIRYGECFSYSDCEYLKFNRTVVSAAVEESSANCVKLASGAPGFFLDSTYVKALKLKAVED